MASSQPPPQHPAIEPHAPPISAAEWFSGLPDTDTIRPLSQTLISPCLAAGFRLSTLPFCSDIDVTRESEDRISSIMGRSGQTGSESDPKMVKRVDNFDDGGDSDDECEGTKTVKRARLVWTAELHKRFVDVVERLGIKSAVPKTIMQMMNVEGLTRENVASHLQKYRLYLKKTDGSGSGSGSDELVSETNGSAGVPISMTTYGGMVPMPVYGVRNSNGIGGYGVVQGREWSGCMKGLVGSSHENK